MTFFNQPFWQIEFLGNTLKAYLIAVVIFIVVLAVLYIFRKIVLKRLEKWAKKTKTDLDDAVISAIETIKAPFYYFLSFFIGFSFLASAPWLENALTKILVIWLVYKAIVAINVLVDFGFSKKRDLEKEKGKDVTILDLLAKITKALVWAFGALFVLSNLGINVTSLVAGLGIGGIAIALALQNILGDLLSTFAIYFDKPFEVGDFIVIGDKKGTVEKIGIKTTRLRSAASGEELIISNKELTTAQVQNFKRIEERRQVFRIGVVYETTLKKLENIPEIIKDIIESQKLTRFDRVHFDTFGDFALSFEISYYVKTSDYAEFKDIHQAILFAIKKVFEKEKIEMAYPTQTLYISKT